MTRAGDFYEDDEPIDDVERAFRNGVTVYTAQPITWPSTWSYTASSNIKVTGFGYTYGLGND